jgi:glutamate decarboxylase
MEGERFHLDPEQAAAYCDENTIGVVAILGSTFDGSYEPVAEIAEALAAGGGSDVPLHVDAASGGFIAPFVQPDLAWDFQLPRVQSINASGHKYGLVYPGVGWALWRDADVGPYRTITDGSELPVFAFAVKPETDYTVFDVSDRLRERGWLVPAYTFPANREDLSVLRVVVRAGMTHDMADLFLADLRHQTEALEGSGAGAGAHHVAAFRH